MLDWTNIHTLILELEQAGKVTRTFRRLDPDRQQAIITAILDEAIEKGPVDLNIKQVAERAGIAVGSLYSYFDNRDGLLDFTVELCVRITHQMFEMARPFLIDTPFREGLRMYIMGGLEWGETQAGLWRFFARAAYHRDTELSDQVVRPIATMMRTIISDMVEAAITRGEIRDTIDRDAMIRLVHTLTIAVGDAQMLPYLNAYFQLVDDTLPPNRLMDALIELIMQGIAKI